MFDNITIVLSTITSVIVLLARSNVTRKSAMNKLSLRPYGDDDENPA